MNRLKAMEVFIAAVDSGSLSAAGRKLRMPLTTVSRKISDLEGHLGARLLVRSTRRLGLTDAGQGFLASCRRILEDLGEAERSAAGEYSAPQGELIVTAPVVYGRLHVLPVVTEFLAAYPRVNLHLVLGDRIVDLRQDSADVAVRIGELPDSRLVATRVGQVRQVVCASPAYLQRHGAPKSPAALARHECVTFSGLATNGAWAFAASGRTQPAPIRARLVVNTAEAAIDAAVAGAGVTRVLSYQVAAAVRAGTLAIVLKNFEPAPSPVSLVHTGGSLLPIKLRAFLDFATPRLRAAMRS